MPCSCCEQCECASSTSKVWVTFDGVEKGLGVCDSESWTFCTALRGGFPSGIAQANALTEYIPAAPPNATALRVTLSSGYSAIGICIGAVAGVGTTWVYEYDLNSRNCPTGEPTLISETLVDTTDQCDDPAACCDETCFGIMPTPTLSLLP